MNLMLRVADMQCLVYFDIMLEVDHFCMLCQEQRCPKSFGQADVVGKAMQNGRLHIRTDEACGSISNQSIRSKEESIVDAMSDA